MIKIAIVEDTPAEAQTLSDSVAAFFKKEGAAFECTVYGDAMSFLTGYKSVYDMVFMDIELPLLDGMTAAEKLRKFDKKILLIFVTNMAQFAVKGYSVDAFDYIVKPVRYQNFEMKMKKALARIRAEMDAIVVAKPGGMIRVRTGDIRFILARGHSIIFHTDGEEIVGSSTSLASLEERLAPSGFLRCNKCYLVNYKHIQAVQGNTVTVYGGDELQISRLRKKQFMTELADWMGK